MSITWLGFKWMLLGWCILLRNIRQRFKRSVTKDDTIPEKELCTVPILSQNITCVCARVCVCVLVLDTRAIYRQHILQKTNYLGNGVEGNMGRPFPDLVFSSHEKNQRKEATPIIFSLSSVIAHYQRWGQNCLPFLACFLLA